VWRTETVLYAPTQRWPSSGYRSPVNCNSLMLCGLPQISSVHCGLTNACCCCHTQATNEYCCRQTFQNGPTQRCVNRIQTTTRVQQMGIPAGTAVTIQDLNHGCGWGGVTFALLSEVQLLPYHRMMPTSRGCIVITIKLKLSLAL